jgi:hypothetical protein
VSNRVEPAPVDVTIAELLEQIRRRDRRLEELRIAHEAAEAARIDGEQKSAQAAQRALDTERERARLEKELAKAKEELRRMKGSRGWRTIQRYRRIARKLRPKR